MFAKTMMVMLACAMLGAACGGPAQPQSLPPPPQFQPTANSTAAVTTWPRGMLWYLDANQAVVSTLPGLWRDPVSLYLWEIDESTAVVRPQTGTFRFMYSTANCTGTAYIGPSIPHVMMPFRVETESGYRVRGDQAACANPTILSAMTTSGCVSASASSVILASDAAPSTVTPIPQPFRGPLHISEIGQLY